MANFPRRKTQLMEPSSYRAAVKTARKMVDRLEAKADAETPRDIAARTGAIQRLADYAQHLVERDQAGDSEEEGPASMRYSWIIDREYQLGTTPAPDLIRHAREQAGHTQSQAAAVIYRKPRAWQWWESEGREMSAAEFELYCRKCNLWNEYGEPEHA